MNRTPREIEDRELSTRPESWAPLVSFAGAGQTTGVCVSSGSGFRPWANQIRVTCRLS